MTAVCSTTLITPLSGAPAAPGVSTTAHPIETGGPGILMPSSSRRAELRGSRDRNHRALESCLALALDTRGHALSLELVLRAELQIALRLDFYIALRRELEAALGRNLDVAIAVDGDRRVAQFNRERVVLERQRGAVLQFDMDAADPGVLWVGRLRDRRMRLVTVKTSQGDRRIEIAVGERHDHQVALVGQRRKTDSCGGHGNPLQFHAALQQAQVDLMIVVAVVAVARINGCNGADFAKAHPRQFVAHDRAQRCDQLAHADAPCTVSAVMKPCPESSRWSTSSTRSVPGELPGKPAISTRSPGRTSARPTRPRRPQVAALAARDARARAIASASSRVRTAGTKRRNGPFPCGAGELRIQCH